jgi:hypothetical protein
LLSSSSQPGLKSITSVSMSAMAESMHNLKKASNGKDGKKSIGKKPYVMCFWIALFSCIC